MQLIPEQLHNFAAQCFGKIIIMLEHALAQAKSRSNAASLQFRECLEYFGKEIIISTKQRVSQVIVGFPTCPSMSCGEDVRLLTFLLKESADSQIDGN